ncbi:MAG: arginine deiminase family protein, partial [Anaerolineae bacterium]
ESPRTEIDAIERVLQPYRELFHIQAPARVDGGDILQVGKRIYLGLSTRSDTNAAEQLQAILQPFGYELHVVEVRGCLHLKSAVTQIGEDALLYNPAWVDRSALAPVKFMEIDASEPYAANAVLIRDSIIYPTSFPRTQERLDAQGIEIVNVDADELAKAEGAVTCCSLILQRS